jgi:hypothetical protein
MLPDVAIKGLVSGHQVSFVPSPGPGFWSRGG